MVEVGNAARLSHGNGHCAEYYLLDVGVHSKDVLAPLGGHVLEVQGGCFYVVGTHTCQAQVRNAEAKRPFQMAEFTIMVVVRSLNGNQLGVFAKG